jgi:hypothetical protein
MKPKINPDFAALIPPLTAEEYAGLETSIERYGCRQPLVTWNGFLLDGHNRLEICNLLEKPYDTVEVSEKLEDEDDAKIWIIQNQFDRRNLQAIDRVNLELKLKPLLAAKAKERQQEHGGTAPGRKSLVAKLPRVSKTRDVLAKAAGVSPRTFGKAEVVLRHSDKETVAKIRSGESSISAEYNRITGAHVSHNSGENEWYTPPEYIAAAKDVLGEIDCDPASSDVANKTVKAKQFFTKERDGLKSKWGSRVWMNPPYAQPLISQFCDALVTKVGSGEVKEACVLVNNATDTGWFHSLVGVAAAVCFTKGRVRFTDPGGKPSAPLQGQAVIYIGKKTEGFTRAFGKLGFVLWTPA